MAVTVDESSALLGGGNFGKGFLQAFQICRTTTKARTASPGLSVFRRWLTETWVNPTRSPFDFKRDVFGRE
jgi:hypothetical protein